MTDSNAELREVKLKGVYPGDTVEIKFNVTRTPVEEPPKQEEKPKEKPEEKQEEKQETPEPSDWNRVGTVIVVSVFLTVIVNHYLNIQAKIKINVTPKPRLHKPYCPKPDPCPDRYYCPKPDRDPCHRFR